MTLQSDPPQTVHQPGVTRRRFVQWTAVAGAGTGLVAVAACNRAPATGAIAAPEASGTEAKMVWSSCNVNCGSRCPLRLNVVGEVITRVDPDNTGDDNLGTQQVRACVRGRSIRQRIYNPDRLKKPMKRVGKRGEGKWAEISWDEAFTTIADNLRRLTKKYGNESIYINYGTGVLGATVARSWPTTASPVARLMNCIGGSLMQYNDYSAANIEAAVDFHYGGWQGSNSNDDTVNSKLVLMFGNNPHETRMSGGGETFVTQTAKKLSGHKVIVFDPRYSDTAMNLGDEWVPLRPGTDAALVAGFAHVMITEKLVDQPFLDRYCSGFDEAHMPAGMPANLSYASYVLGLGADKTEKTSQWAARITGVPADDIRRLAREIALTKPCAITQGWGPQRHSNGENQSRAPMLLAAMTGNIGISGGGWSQDEAQGTFKPNVFTYYTSVACNHCEDPICIRVCPTQAMHKGANGIVSVDPTVCIGCRYCEWACPYGAPQFSADKGVMTKCDFCQDYLAQGRDPACVAACPSRVLHFGEIGELRKKHGDTADVEPLPDPRITRPHLVITPHKDAQKSGHGHGVLANPNEV